MQPLNVLSLFDGMSCGKVALERAGIPIANYYASEIDKYAIQIAKKNHPDIIHLGDVTNWADWNLPKIDLIIGGSPCQGFSYAGRGLNFDDPRSKLFFTFINILHAFNPRWFLLENVKMKKEWMDVISCHMEVQPVLIDSALVSAQSRKRLYWTNWDVDQPEDRGIYLKDIIESGTVDREKSYTIDTHYGRGGKQPDWVNGKPLFKYESQRRNMVQVGMADDKYGHDIQRRIYSDEGKSPTLLAIASGGAIPPKIAIARQVGRKINAELWQDGVTYRKLTPVECERLQTLPDGYTEGVSNTQRYKMLGNGWTVDVLAHIFRNMENQCCPQR
jgi:DNA-cytosine methyltransferase